MSTRTAINHTTRHKVASSHTLMRRAVKKPAPSLKRKLRISSAIDLNSSHITLSAKENKLGGHPKKIVHIKKSDKIRHFIELANHTEPVTPIYASTPSNEPVIIKPTNNHPSLSTKPAPVKSSLDLILERGLDRATSHLEPSPKIKKKKSRHLNTLTITSVVVLIVTVATLLSTNSI
jgi:hypothetical protein